ncbi:MAG: tetratricopeptide repeat protein, partial [Cyanobacteria bacterium P01_E01_bin.42]
EQEHQAKELLREFVGKKTLLLLIENLDMVFEGLEETGQHQLRAYLYNYKFCTILATSQSLFKEVKIKDYPFYGSFRFHHLEELSSDEAADLLANIAQLDEDEELETFLQSLTGQERVKAVHHLAGGNPRIYIVFSGFLSRESLDELVPAFMKMLDELTPYYQERMLALSARQRKIINFLCDRRYACLFDDVAQRCFLDAQSAKEELRELRTKGYLRMEEIGQERFYELREPLLRFCLQVKKQKNKPISLFVDFLRLWYSREELEARLSDRIELREQSTFSLQSKDLQAIGIARDRELFIQKEYFLSALQTVEEEIDPRVIAFQKQYQLHFDNNEFSKALQYGEKLIILRGKVDDFENYGFCLYQLSRYQEALAYYEKILETEPNDFWYWTMTGNILDGMKQYKDAILAYDKALEIEPKYAWVWVRRGLLLNQMKQYQESFFSYDKAIEIEPKSAWKWLEQCYFLKDLEQLQEMFKECNEMIKINPKSVWSWIIQSVFLVQLERYEDSLISCDKAIEIEPRYACTWIIRGICLNELKQYEEAITSYNKAIKIDLTYSNAWVLRGNTLDNLGRYKDALFSYDKALEIDPKSTFAWADRSSTLNQLKRYEDALTSCDKGIEIDSEDAYTWALRGINLSELKRYEEAIESYNEAIRIDSDYAAAWCARGNTLNSLGRYEEAIFSYDKAIEINPKSAWIWVCKSKTLDKLERYEEALMLCNKAIEIEPKDAYPRLLKVSILLSLKHLQGTNFLGLKQYKDAINSFHESIKIYSESTWIWIIQGADLKKMKQLMKIDIRHENSSIFAQGLTRSIPMLMLSTFDRERVQLWLEIWQELTADRPEFEIPLRLLAKAIEYKEKNGDPRILLTLPIEEREILKQLLEEASNEPNSVDSNDT